MRISTSQIQQRAVETMLDQQARLSHTQQQVATGKRILDPADDPAGATRAMGLEREIAATNQYQTNTDHAYHRLAMEEDVFANVTNLLQRTTELTIQGNNDSLTAGDRRMIAVELRQHLDELLDLANTRTASGEYLFGGFQGNTLPFTRDGNGEVTYSGDQGQRFLHIGPGVEIAVGDSGDEVFQLVRSGNGVFRVQEDPANRGTGVVTTSRGGGSCAAHDYRLTFTQAAPEDPVTYEVLDSASNPVASGTYTSGNGIEFNGVGLVITGTPADGDSFTTSPSGHQDIFATIRHLTEAFEGAADDPVSAAKLHNAINRALDELRLASENITEMRARVGSRLNLAERQRDYNDTFLLTAEETLSNVQSLDMAEAISRLQQQITGLEAAQKTYVQIQGLSLFDYLR